MKVLYVAGPYRGPDAWAIRQNIFEAERVGQALWGIGAAVIVPHANTMNYQGSLPDEVWLEGDLEILRRCDGIVLLPTWWKSQGAKVEKDCAEVRGMPVFEWPVDLEKIKEFIHAH